MKKKKKLVDTEKLIHDLVYAAHPMIDADVLSPYDSSDMIQAEVFTDLPVQSLTLNEVADIIEKLEEE